MADKWQKYGLDISSITQVTDPVLSTLDKGIGALNTAINFLTNILKILQLYINAFSSFSSLLDTFIKFSRNTISGYAKDLINTGVYLNIFVPPAFQQGQLSNVDYTKLSSGGFNEFLQSLKVALNNTADVNTPKFSDQASVGGFIIMVDAETPDAFFRGTKFLTDNLGFTDIIPINTKTYPPTGIKSSAGYIEQSDKTSKFGIKIQWDPPPVRNFTHYRISRSEVSGGGEIETTHPVPNKLFGPKGHPEEGLFNATWQRIFKKTDDWPEITTKSYKDPNFNKGSPKDMIINPLTWKGSYIDYEVNVDETRKYYYVIQSGFAALNLWSPYSPEVAVPTFPKNCVSNDMVGAALHKGGNVHLISVGDKLGQWSALRVSEIVPFISVIVDLVNAFLKGLEGSLKTNSQSFLNFINGINQKFKTYKSYIQTISGMIVALENIFTGIPEIGVLNLPPMAGGTKKFIDRVSKAAPPPSGFTGTDGITMGVVFVYGNYRVDIDALGNKVTDMEAQTEALSKTFATIEKLLT